MATIGPFACYADIPAANINDVTGETDNCAGVVTVAFVSDGPNPGCSGTVVRTYSLTDECGNSSTLTQNITDQRQCTTDGRSDGWLLVRLPAMRISLQRTSMM